MPNQPLTAEQVIALLGLQPLPIEGGHFVETDRAGELQAALIADSHAGPRSRATAIYYFLTPATISALHRLPGPEITITTWATRSSYSCSSRTATAGSSFSATICSPASGPK